MQQRRRPRMSFDGVWRRGNWKVNFFFPPVFVSLWYWRESRSLNSVSSSSVHVWVSCPFLILYIAALHKMHRSMDLMISFNFISSHLRTLNIQNLMLHSSQLILYLNINVYIALSCVQLSSLSEKWAKSPHTLLNAEMWKEAWFCLFYMSLCRFCVFYIYMCGGREALRSLRLSYH